MDTIASFEVDHTKLKPGIYISRIDGDIVTYDLRFVFPNAGVYVPVAAMHTVEHLFAVRARNGKYGKNIVYFGPMGCRTGFYLLTTGLSHDDAIELIKDTVLYIRDYEGAIPGATERECGNFREHDLSEAKEFCGKYYEIISELTKNDIQY